MVWSVAFISILPFESVNNSISGLRIYIVVFFISSIRCTTLAVCPCGLDLDLDLVTLPSSLFTSLVAGRLSIA